MALGGIDSGLTFHGEAGRAIPEYQNQGLLRKLLLALNDEFNVCWPEWDDFKGTSTQTHFYDEILDKIVLHVRRVCTSTP
jgi:hypothetical protein